MCVYCLIKNLNDVLPNQQINQKWTEDGEKVQLYVVKE